MIISDVHKLIYLRTS